MPLGHNMPCTVGWARFCAHPKRVIPKDDGVYIMQGDCRVGTAAHPIRIASLPTAHPSTPHLYLLSIPKKTPQLSRVASQKPFCGR